MRTLSRRDVEFQLPGGSRGQQFCRAKRDSMAFGVKSDSGENLNPQLEAGGVHLIRDLAWPARSQAAGAGSSSAAASLACGAPEAAGR
jgi:hypothetical protein